MLTHADGQPPGLIHSSSSVGVRIWIKRWSSLIEERRRELHFYRDKLDIDPSREEALEFLRKKYASYIPSSIRKHVTTTRPVPAQPLAGQGTPTEATASQLAP